MKKSELLGQTIMITATVLICWVATFAQEKFKDINIAVNDLSGQGLDRSTAIIISDRLRSELIGTEIFRVMERNEMESVLKEQGFQRSGACDESSCLVEVGQLLGVERIVAGSVGQIGTLYTISLRMINVATGQIMYTANVDHDGDIKEFLAIAVKTAAQKLALNVGSEFKKTFYSGKTGDIYITSVPSGAGLELDGNVLAGKTPLTIKGIAAGQHRIVVRQNEYYGSQAIMLEPDDLLKINIPMERRKGVLKVFTEPDDAIVYVDGMSAGITPCKIDAIAIGEHQVVIRKSEYLTEITTTTVGFDSVCSISFTLRPAAYLAVTTNKSNTRILINGKPYAQGTLPETTFPAGKIEISAELAGFVTVNKTINLEAGTHSNISIEMVTVFGSLLIVSDPLGAKVAINGDSVGVTPYNNDRLIPANYRLDLTRDYYTPISDKIELTNNTLVRKTYQLTRNEAYHDSIKLFIAAIQKAALEKKEVEFANGKRIQWIRRIVFGSGAAIAGGIGIFYNIQTANALSTYNSTESYASSIHDANWKAYDNSAQTRNIWYTVAGVLLAGFVISIPF